MKDLIFCSGVVLLLYGISAILVRCMFLLKDVYNSTYDLFMLPENSDLRSSLDNDYLKFLKFIIYTPVLNTIWFVSFIGGFIGYLIILPFKKEDNKK